MQDKSLSFVIAADKGFHHGLEPLFKSFLLANRQFAPLRLLLMDCGLPDGFPGQLEQKTDRLREPAWYLPGISINSGRPAALACLSAPLG